MTTAEVTDTMSTEEDSTAARTTAISSGREVDDDTTRLVLAILYCSQAVLTSAGNGLVLFVLCRWVRWLYGYTDLSLAGRQIAPLT